MTRFARTTSGPEGPSGPDTGLMGVLEVAHDVLSDLELDAVLERVAAAAREVAGGRSASLGVLDASRRRHERFVTAGAADPAGHRTVTPPRGRDVLSAPVVVAGEPFGTLYLAGKAGGGPFTERDEQALALLSEIAGVAIDHARRYAAVESQRRALS